MKKQTKQSEITVPELAALSNLTTRRIRQLAEEDKLPKIKRGKLPMPEAVNQLFAHYQKASEELTRERLALLTAKRKAAELELADAGGAFIPRDVAEQTLCEVLRQYHSYVRQALEFSGPAKRREKLEQLGATREIAAAFFEFDQAGEIAMITRIEERCEQAAKEEIPAN